MERCLDCNSLLTKEERICLECGSKVGGDEGSAADFAASLVSMLFYLSIAALIICPFVSSGPSFLFCLMISCALLFIMRTAKDNVERVKKR
jgi:hypothetical protein